MKHQNNFKTWLNNFLSDRGNKAGTAKSWYEWPFFTELRNAYKTQCNMNAYHYRRHLNSMSKRLRLFDDNPPNLSVAENANNDNRPSAPVFCVCSKMLAPVCFLYVNNIKNRIYQESYQYITD